MPRLAHQDPSEGKDLHEALRDVSPAEAEEFKKNVLSPAEIERRKNRKANPTPSRPEVLMSDTALRASLIRLAFQNPSLRADILPLVSKEAGSYQEYVDRKRSKGEKPLTEDAWRSRTQGGGKGEKKDEGKGEAGQPAEKKPAKSFKKNYRPKMESVMKKHELTDDDAAQVIQFSIDRPKKGKPQSPAELMRRFMQNAKPETKARMKNMSPAEFMIMLRAVLDQEEGGGKAASFRAGLIRLAYANPNLRPTLLPLIEKHAGEGEGEGVARAKKAVEGLARLVAAKVGGTVGGVEGRASYAEGYTSATAEVVVPNLPAITSGGDDDAVVAVEMGVNPDGRTVIYFRYVLPQPRLKWLADKVANLSVSGADIEDAVQKATKSAQALPAVLEPMREREALRRKSAKAFKKAMPEMKEWLRKALIQSGFMGSVKVWGHSVGSSGVFTTDAGIPYAAESVVIEGLLTEDEGRDVQRSKEVLVNTRKVLTKALSRFFSNGVAAKLSSKPAYWSSYTYNTTVILYFKDAPVENMKLAGDEADKSALAEDADPASHDQNLASTWEKVDGKQAMDKTATPLPPDKFNQLLDFMLNTYPDMESAKESLSVLTRITGNRSSAQAIINGYRSMRGADFRLWHSISPGDKPQREMVTKWLDGSKT